MKLPRVAQALRQPSFVAYLGGHALSTVGTWGQRVVLYWIAWEATESSAVLGLIAAADLLPAVFTAPFAGTLADQLDRRVLALWLQVLSVVPAVLALLAVLSGASSVPVLVGLSLLTGILNGFDHPVRMVLVGSLVERDTLTSAVTLNSIVFNLGRMVGPVLGGIAIATGQMGWVFLFNALSYLVFALVLARLRSVLQSAQSGEDVGAFGWPQVLPHLTITHWVVLVYFAAIALCIRPLFELLPAFADALASGPDRAGQLFAWFTSAQALGAALGGVAIGTVAGRGRHVPAIFGSGLLIVLSTVLFLLSGAPWLALLSLAIVSGGVVANGIACQVLLQTEVSDRVRGKVLSVYTMMFRGLPALGALIIGALAQFVPQASLIWASTALIAFTTGTAWILLSRSGRRE